MNKAKRIPAFLLSVLMTVSLLSACGSKETAADSSVSSVSSTAAASSQAAPKEPVTIVANISEGELSTEQIAAFEKDNPDIKIKLEKIDGAKMASMLATGTAPDIIYTNGAFELSSWVIRGIATDLTSYIDKSSLIKIDDLLPVVNVYRFDGETIGQGPIYGLPKDWSNDFALFYNKRCFDAAGISVPDSTRALTWAEVMDLAKKLTIKKDGKIVQYGLSATEWGQTNGNFNQMLQYIVSAGGKISSDDNKTMNLDVQAVKDYLAMWVDAAKNNVGPNALNNDQTSGGDLFLSDRSALLIDGYWYGGVLRSNEKTKTHLDDFGMLPTPTAPGGKRIAATGGATGLIINKTAKDPEAAFKVFEYYIAGKPADDRAKAGWGMPIFKSKMDLLPQETDFDTRLLNVLNDETKYQTEFLPVNPYLAGGGWGVFDKYYAPLLFDKTTIDEAVKGMTKDVNVIVTEAVNALGK